MPEGDTIWRLAERFQPLVGRVIHHSDFRVPALATASLAGERISRIWPYGKHLYWQCGQRILHTHQLMDGTWRSHAVGDRWSAPAHTARLVLQIDGVELVGHSLGIVELWPAREYGQRTAHLGPDILAADWAAAGRDEALRRILDRPQRSIGEALLDQRNLAGVGNEYRAEVCFLQGLHPAVPVSHTDVGAVIDLAAKLMRANLTTPMRTFTGIHRAGENTFIFGRKHRPCRRCGTRIESSTLGGGTSVTSPDAGQERIIWWCPTCQAGAV